MDFVLGLRMCMEHDNQKFQRRIQVNFEEMEQQISDYAKAHHAMLDYTAQSIIQNNRKVGLHNEL